MHHFSCLFYFRFYVCLHHFSSLWCIFVFLLYFQAIRGQYSESGRKRPKIVRNEVLLVQISRNQHGMDMSHDTGRVTPWSLLHTSNSRMTQPTRVPWHCSCQHPRQLRIFELLAKFVASITSISFMISDKWQLNLKLVQILGNLWL